MIFVCLYCYCQDIATVSAMIFYTVGQSAHQVNAEATDGPILSRGIEVWLRGGCRVERDTAVGDLKCQFS